MLTFLSRLRKPKVLWNVKAVREFAAKNSCSRVRILVKILQLVIFLFFLKFHFTSADTKKIDDSALTRLRVIRARESVNFWITTSTLLTPAIACDSNLLILLRDWHLIRNTLRQASARLIENKNLKWHDYQTLTLISVVFGSAPINELSVLGPKVLIYWNEAVQPLFRREFKGELWKC